MHLDDNMHSGVTTVAVSTWWLTCVFTCILFIIYIIYNIYYDDDFCVF